jgi:hypothetical protein
MTRIEAHIFVNRISSNHHYYICGLCGGGGGRNKNTIIRRNMLLLLHTYVYLCISVWRRMRKRRERESSSWILYKIARVMNGFSWESGTSVCVCCALSLSLALSLPLSLSLSLSLFLSMALSVYMGPLGLFNCCCYLDIERSLRKALFSSHRLELTFSINIA